MEGLLKLVFSNPGLIFNMNSIAKSLGRSRITISNYVEYLKYTLAIRSLSNYRRGVLVSSRKFKKLYPATTSLTFSYSNVFFEKEFFGKVLETYVVNTLNANFYFKKNYEVDIILERNGKLFPVEVKENVEDKDIRNFTKILELLKLKEGLIVSLEQFDERIVEDKKIRVVPAWSLDFLEKVKS
jgi:predicted AAA+ superfamily ATPase